MPQIDNVTVEEGPTKASGLPKRRNDFPLWPHPNGQWAKRIDSGIRYFGTRDDEEGAQEEYRKVLKQREDPHPAGEPLTLGDKVNLFLEEKEESIPHILDQRTWDDYALVGDQIIKVLGRSFEFDDYFIAWELYQRNIDIVVRAQYQRKGSWLSETSAEGDILVWQRAVV